MGFTAPARHWAQTRGRCLLAGGEDYELLFTARGNRISEMHLSKALALPVTEVGRIVRERGLRGLDGTAGFTHF